MERPTRPHRPRRYLASRRSQASLVAQSIPTVEMLDAHERAAGGRWREAQTLAPGETVIRDERLT